MRMHRPAVLIATLLLAACKPAAQTHTDVVTPRAVDTQAPAAAPVAETPPTWRATGTEPFWGVRVHGDELVFTTPDDQQGQVLPASMQQQGDATVYSGADADRGYSLTLTPGECSDGMSDRVFNHRAEFVLGDARYAGCAAAAGEPWGE